MNLTSDPAVLRAVARYHKRMSSNVVVPREQRMNNANMLEHILAKLESLGQDIDLAWPEAWRAAERGGLN